MKTDAFMAQLKKRAEARPAALWCGALVLVIAVLFATGAPMGGAFSWPDSPRHALNGAFVKDLIGAAPFADPTGYAYDYYSQYPALTILFYPPFFSFILAFFYALFGVSQETAVFVLFLFHAALACGVFAFARLWLQRPAAFGAALIVAAAPEVAFWGRQVMLDMPAMSFLIWSAFFFVRHMRGGRIVDLYLAAALVVFAAHMKMSMVFMAAPFAIALFQAQGRAMFRNKHHYIIAGLALAGLAPLIFIMAFFGQGNMQSVSGISDSVVARFSVEGWLWYLARLPEQFGWTSFAAFVAAAGVLAYRARRARLKIDNGLFLAAWFGVGYLFFSSIDLKEVRFTIHLLPPLAIIIGLGAEALFARRRLAAQAVMIAAGAAAVLVTVATRPVHFVDGYKDVVAYVSEIAPRNSNILFSGFRDGAFIFNMRAHSDRPDLSIVRADKLLLRIAIRPGLGVEQKDYARDEIQQMIGDLAVHYVVAQPDFWTHLEQMDRLQTVLRSDAFEEVARFRTPANYNAQEKELILYKNLGEVAEGPVEITNELLIINRNVSGTIAN
ncbi:MAG: glycosyltransferase family 39 protein [Pseudomonadota bacterium]